MLFKRVDTDGIWIGTSYGLLSLWIDSSVQTATLGLHTVTAYWVEQEGRVVFDAI